MKCLRLLCIGLLCSTLSFGQELQEGKVWSLKDCIDYALANNIAIKKTILDKDAAIANYEQSKNNRLPSLNGSGSANVSNGYTIDPITSDFVNRTILSNSFGLNGQVALYQGNRLNLEIEKNEYLTAQAALYQTQTQNNISLSVLQQYLQALYYFEGIRIAENTLASSAAELDFINKKFENGAVAKKDQADVATQYAQNQYSLSNSQTLYAQQVLKLKQLLELPPEYEFEIEQISLPELSTAIPGKIEVFNESVAYLPDVKIFDVQNNILEKELKITKAAARPTLSAGLGINTGFTNTMNYTYFTQVYRNFSQQANLTLSIPIFSKFQNRTNTKLAAINIEQNKLSKTEASKTLYANIETAWLNATTSVAQQSAAKVARDNAQLAYELAGKKFEFGGLTTTELAVSRTTYLNNEQTYLQTRYMSVLYRQLLNYYQGKSFDIVNK